jgi:hypothetical protein
MAMRPYTPIGRTRVEGLPYPQADRPPQGDGKPSPYIACRYRRIRVEDWGLGSQRSGGRER